MQTKSNKVKLLTGLLCLAPTVMILVGAIGGGPLGFVLGSFFMIFLAELVKATIKLFPNCRFLADCRIHFHCLLALLVWMYGWAWKDWTWRSLLAAAIVISLTEFYLWVQTVRKTA